MRYSAGYGAVVVTPEVPVPLCGYGVFLGRSAHDVLDDLYVRAVVIEEGSVRFSLLTFDLVGFSPDFAREVRLSVAEAIETEVDLVTVLFTHTHSGPPTAPIRGMGDLDPAYAERLVAAARESALEAVATLTSCDLRFASGEVEPIGFNRVAGDYSGIDSTMSVVSAIPEASGVEPIALVHYACHPVTLGVNQQISADYPGRLVASLRRSGYRALFVQGFCGNIDPVVNLDAWGTGTETDIDRYGAHLAERAVALMGRSEAVSPESAAIGVQSGSVPIPLDLGDDTSLHESRFRNSYSSLDPGKIEMFLSSWREQWKRVKHGPAEAAQVEMPIQIVTLGDVRLACIGAEVFSSFGLALRARYERVLPVGYANGVVGYLPDADAYRKTADYAAHLAPLFYSAAPMDASAPDLVLDYLYDILNAEENL